MGSIVAPTTSIIPITINTSSIVKPLVIRLSADIPCNIVNRRNYRQSKETDNEAYPKKHRGLYRSRESFSGIVHLLLIIIGEIKKRFLKITRFLAHPYHSYKKRREQTLE